MNSLVRVLAVACILACPAYAHAQSLPQSMVAGIDSIFADLKRPDTPGCVLGIFRDGRLVYAQGYGCADLEHMIPIRPETLFDIGSTSKQFTAAALILLEQDGKLSLDDDVRKHIPELPDYDRTITLRHLLNHTSGIPDYLGLMAMAGYQNDDVTTPDDALRVIAKQRTLEFEPGAKHAYSNTGYALIAEIVRRVSGKTLGQFAAERIFAPLGMAHTLFLDDHTMVVPNRAVGYEVEDDGSFARAVSYNEVVGDGGLHTCVEDMLKWDENFYTPKVGGPAMIRELQRRGVLNNGDTIPYGGGLELGMLHGLPIVEHAGANDGFRSQLLRVPSEHLSVAVFANCRAITPEKLAVRVVETLLADRLANEKVSDPTPAPAPAMVAVDTATFDAYVGDYELEETPGFIFSVMRRKDLYLVVGNGQPPDTLLPTSDTSFVLKGLGIAFDFGRTKGRAADRMTFVMDKQPYPARRVTVVEAPATLEQFAGSYRSSDLETGYTLAVENGKLVARHSRREPVTLTPKRTGGLPLFAGDHWLLRKVRFEQRADGTVTAMLVSFARNRNVRFERVK